MENISKTILAFGRTYQGILKMAGAVIAFLLTLTTLINLINISGYMGLSGYPVFSEIIYSACQILSILCAIAGFCMLGVMLLLKPQNILMPIALGILACAAFFGAAEDFFYYIWQSKAAFSYYFSYPYLFMAFLSLITAVAWAFPAMAGFMKDKTKFTGNACIMMIIPAALFVIYLFTGLFTGTLYFGSFLNIVLRYGLLAIASVVVLAADGKPAMESIREMNDKNAEQRWQDATSIQPGQTAYASYQQKATSNNNNQQQQTATTPNPQQQRPISPEPEGYIGIVKLIILSIVTFGVYVYIWIYKTTRFFDGHLNRQGSFSPGVEVVLCLFVPFYFIYWIYKHTKAADEAHRMRGNVSNSDLAIINLLLCIFGLSIVAYALLQDQINKLVTGFTEPQSYARPQNVNNAQPQANCNYNFDPMTGEPIRKEAPVNEVPVEIPTEEPVAEVFTEVPIQEASPAVETAEVPQEEPAQTFFEEVTEITPKEEIPAEEIPAAEPVTETTQTVTEQLENVKMLKQLLDAGVLTQEEFELKKKDILGL